MGNILEYKGYHAKVEFDEEDMILVGEVFGIQDSLSFHGKSTEEIVEMFHQSVDNYLEFCAEIGKNPDKEFKGSFNVRINQKLHREAAFEANRKGITLNQYVEDAIRDAVDKRIKTDTYIVTMGLEPATYKKLLSGEIVRDSTDYVSTKKTY